MHCAHTFATYGASRVAPHLDLAEPGALCIEREQTTDERVPVTHYEFQCLVRLKRTDDAREHAQDACLTSGGGQLWRRCLRIQTPVTRPLEGNEC